jgi:hypothetical protein
MYLLIFPTFTAMRNKIHLISYSVFVLTILILSFVINSKNHRIEKGDDEIVRLKEQKNQLSFTFETLNYRRIRRDSLAEINSKKYDEQIRLLDNANDSIITATVRRLIAE